VAPYATATGRRHRLSWRTSMQIDKQQIIDLLKNRGDNDKVAQADSELPDKVDTDEHSGLLAKLGINPQELLGGLAGGLGDKLGL
jgi:hypothetical protein